MKSNFLPAMFGFFLAIQGATAFASDTRPVFRSISNHPLTIYSIRSAVLVDQFFDPNRLFDSFATVRLTGVYESNCTSVELSAHLSQSRTGDELMTELSLRDVSGPIESVAIEPRICSSITNPKDFDLQLQFQPNSFGQIPGIRKWRVSTKYGPMENEHEYEFSVTLDSATGFSLNP